MRFYFKAPYSDKNMVRSLGAYWDARIKMWYIYNPTEKDYVTFAPWILKDNLHAFIATEYLYLIEGKRICWKCGFNTRVLGFGIGEYYYLYKTGDNEFMCDYEQDLIERGEEVHLAWTDNENTIPKRLLHYIKRKYNVKTGFSKTLNGNCFANHCDNCDALQGNHYVFESVTTCPFLPCCEGKELVEKMKDMTVIEIPIDDDILVEWNVILSTNDNAFLKYATRKELILSKKAEDVYATFLDINS